MSISIKVKAARDFFVIESTERISFFWRGEREKRSRVRELA
jgi:hypothetical protein